MATEDRRRRKLIKPNKPLTLTHLTRGMQRRPPPTPKAVERYQLLLSANRKRGVNTLALSSEVWRGPNSATRVAGKTQGQSELSTQGSIRRTRSYNTISNRLPLPRRVQTIRATTPSTVTIPTGILRDPRGWGE